MERRKPLQRKTPLKQGAELKRSGRINPVSKRRARVNRQRSKNLREAWGPKPWLCQFARFGSRHLAGVEISMQELRCFGEVDGHEILKRSRSGRDENLLDPSGMVPLCSHHNSWVERFPKEAEALGLSIPSS